MGKHDYKHIINFKWHWSTSFDM